MKQTARQLFSSVRAPRKTEPEEPKTIEYRVPKWLLTYNVKIAAELARLDIKADLVTAVGGGPTDDGNAGQSQSALNSPGERQADSANLTPSIEDMTPPTTSSPESEERNATADGSGQNTEYQYRVQPDVYLKLLDLVSGSLYSENIPGDSHTSGHGILLHTPVPDSVYYLGPIVERVAAELGVDLITIGFEDIADIALDFHFQALESYGKGDAEGNQGKLAMPSGDLAQFYFGKERQTYGTKGTEQTHRAVSAILDSSVLKRSLGRSSERQEEPSAVGSSPTLLYIRDVSNWGYENGILKVFRERVQKRRKNKESMTLLTTVYSDKAAEKESWGWKTGLAIEELLLDQSSIIDMTPREIGAVPVEAINRRSIEVNLRRLKRLLRQMIADGHTLDLLTPQPPWDQAGPLLLPHASEISRWSTSALEQVAEQVVGRARRGEGGSKLDHVSEVIVRLRQNREALKKWMGEDKPSSFQEELSKIRKDCGEYEKGLLGCVVDPETLHATLNDVIVNQELKDAMRQLLSLSNLRPTSTSPGLLKMIRIGGALLYGPPGTGKTHLARAVAKDFGINMVAISPANIVNPHVGETEKYIKAAFSLSAKLAPCVLFIDEVEALFAKHSNGDRHWQRTATNQFLMEMDGLATSENAPFVLAATNRPMDLDEAFLRRLPQKILFSLPSEHGRAAILRTFLQESGVSPSVTIEALARMTDRFSGSDLRSLCGQAALIYAVEQTSMASSSPPSTTPNRLLLELRHFEKALARTKPSVSYLAISDIEDFAQRFNSPLPSGMFHHPLV